MVNLSIPPAATSIDGYLVSLYGAHRISDGAYMNAQMSYGDHRFMGVRSPTRELPIGRAYHNDGSALAGRIELGRMFRSATLAPEAYVSVGYRQLDEGAIDEIGGYGLSLAIDERISLSLETELGVRFRRSFDTPLGIVRPRMGVAWVHDFYAGENSVSAVFRDMPDYVLNIPISVQSPNALRLGGGIDFLNQSAFTLTAGFESDIRRGVDRTSAKLGFRLAF